jgi:hypothetical protein
LRYKSYVRKTQEDWSQGQEAEA